LLISGVFFLPRRGIFFSKPSNTGSGRSTSFTNRRTPGLYFFDLPILVLPFPLCAQIRAGSRYPTQLLRLLEGSPAVLGPPLQTLPWAAFLCKDNFFTPRALYGHFFRIPVLFLNTGSYLPVLFFSPLRNRQLDTVDPFFLRAAAPRRRSPSLRSQDRLLFRIRFLLRLHALARPSSFTAAGDRDTSHFPLDPGA